MELASGFYHLFSCFLLIVLTMPTSFLLLKFYLGLLKGMDAGLHRVLLQSPLVQSYSFPFNLLRQKTWWYVSKLENSINSLNKYYLGMAFIFYYLTEISSLTFYFQKSASISMSKLIKSFILHMKLNRFWS